jgi:hypothetical protein
LLFEQRSQAGTADACGRTGIAKADLSNHSPNDCYPGTEKGTVKDVQGLLRHSRAAIMTDVYMQEIPEGVEATVDSISLALRRKVRGKRSKKEGSKKFATNLVPNATKPKTALAVSC